MTFQMAFVSQNPLTYLVIPNTWTWTWLVMMLFPINLVFQMSDFRYEIKLRYLISELKHWLKYPGRSVSTNTNTNWSWFLVDPVDDEGWRAPGPRTRVCFQPLTMRSKETEELVHSSWSLLFDHHLLTLHWLGNRIFFKYF